MSLILSVIGYTIGLIVTISLVLFLLQAFDVSMGGDIILSGKLVDSKQKRHKNILIAIAFLIGICLMLFLSFN